MIVLPHKYILGDSAVKIAESIERALAIDAFHGARLPPIRNLAETLAVSPATVSAAYARLHRRGLVVSNGRRGTVARPRRSGPTSTSDSPVREGLRDLANGSPDPALLPSLERFVRSLTLPVRTYDGPLNVPELIDLASDHFRLDGIPTAPIAIVGGALDGIERVLREHLRPGDSVAVEDPCFTGVLEILTSLGLVPAPVALDDEGPRPTALRKALRSASALVVTPRAQNPTGAAISPKRSRELRTVLHDYPDLLVIEDDHAGPVSGTQTFTLIEKRATHWAVVRSVSKFLGPDLRIAFVTGDETTIRRLEGRQASGIRWVSHVLQRLTLAVWSDRRTTTLLERAAKKYESRRRALIDALATHGIEAHGRSGLNVWIPVRSEASVVVALADAGWAVRAGEHYRLDSAPGIRVTIAELEPSDARRFAADLAMAMRRSSRSTA